MGALVRKGDVLVRLNPRDAEIRLQQARAAEEQTQAALRAAQARVGLTRPGAVVVQRPVFATMPILALTVVGAFALFSLGLDRFPDIDIPIVSITTANPGSSPEQIEREVTDIIEGTVNTVAGIDDLRSTSVEGLSQVIIQFNLGKDVDVATQEVRQKVDLVLRDLPETADPPVVQKLDPDAAPILLYAVSSRRPIVQLAELIDDIMVERLESVSGVGDVILYGGRPREIQVYVNPERLRAYNLTVIDVANAVRAQNLELPGGKIDEGAQSLTVRTLGRLQCRRAPHLFPPPRR